MLGVLVFVTSALPLDVVEVFVAERKRIFPAELALDIVKNRPLGREATLLAGGAPGKRMALPNSRILVHQPSGGFQGQSTDIEIHAREVLALRARVDELYAKHTSQSIERVHADMERDRFFTGSEAVAYGLVDRVIERRELGRGARGFGQG